jgi:hypothetical protein
MNEAQSIAAAAISPLKIFNTTIQILQHHQNDKPLFRTDLLI